MKVRKIVNTVLITILLHSISLAQSKNNKYFNTKGMETDSAACFYFTTSIKGLDHDTVKSYYCKGSTLRSIEYVSPKIKDGFIYDYYPNGNLMSKTYFKNAVAIGLSEEYFSNGKMQCEKQFILPGGRKGSEPYGYLVENAWDSLGRQTVKNYYGYYKHHGEEGKIVDGYRDSIWTVYQSGKKTIVEKYQLGKFVEGDRLVNGKSIHYTQIEVAAAPKGGIENLYRYISKTLRYPMDARKKRIEGKVFVKFIIEPNGTVSSVEVVKGTYESLDEEAIRVIKLIDDWVPGYQRGIPVRQAYTVPINFKFK